MADCAELGTLTNGHAKYEGVVRRKEKYKLEDKLCLVWVICAITIITSVGTWLVIGLTYCNRNSSVAQGPMQNDPTPAIACLDCSLLQLDASMSMEEDPLIKQLKVKKTEGQKPKCCAYDSSQMSAMLEATIRRWEPPVENLPRYSPSGFHFSPASAHMRFYPPAGDNGEGVVFTNTSQLARFKTRPNTLQFNEHLRGVGVSETELIIRFTGLYIVYSSIEYKPDISGSCDELPVQNWSHHVKLIRPSENGFKYLLQTAHNCCQNCLYNEDTKFTSGVFKLHKRDKLRVEVMAYGLHHYAKDTSFLGVAMLGSNRNRNPNPNPNSPENTEAVQS